MDRDSLATRFFKYFLGFFVTWILISILCFGTIQYTLYMVPIEEFVKLTGEPPSTQRALLENHSQKRPTYYEVLNAPLFSEDEVIKRAYREKLKQIHPDKVKGDKEVEEAASREVQQVTEAYQFLMSKDRCMYDFHLGSGIGRFADCNQKWLDRKREELVEKRKEAEERRQETTPSGNAVAKSSTSIKQKLAEAVKDIGAVTKTVLVVAG
ncbi:DnaJ-domain-containing protein [Daldinia bambusicola]|nr:DnaJ-domain-containing protein [Daldinia bambusicola]